MGRAEAERLTASLRADLEEFDEQLVRAVEGGLDRLWLVGLLTKMLSEITAACPDEDFIGPIRQHLFQPRVDLLLAGRQ